MIESGDDKSTKQGYRHFFLRCIITWSNMSRHWIGAITAALTNPYPPICIAGTTEGEILMVDWRTYTDGERGAGKSAISNNITNQTPIHIEIWINALVESYNSVSGKRVHRSPRRSCLGCLASASSIWNSPFHRRKKLGHLEAYRSGRQFVCLFVFVWTDPIHQMAPSQCWRIWRNVFETSLEKNCPLVSFAIVLLQEGPVIDFPPRTSSITSACWSPWQPSVIAIGLANGVVEVWDILFSIAIPKHQFRVSRTAIPGKEPSTRKIRSMWKREMTPYSFVSFFVCFFWVQLSVSVGVKTALSSRLLMLTVAARWHYCRSMKTIFSPIRNRWDGQSRSKRARNMATTVIKTCIIANQFIITIDTKEWEFHPGGGHTSLQFSTTVKIEFS